MACEDDPVFVGFANTRLSGMDIHTFVFASLDGQTILVVASRIWRVFVGTIYRRDGRKKQAKQLSPAKIKVWYH
jgi:hypothetical protein